MRAIDADSVIRQMMRGYELMMEQMADRSAEVRGAMEDARLLFTYAVYDEPTLDVAPVRHGHWAEKKLGLVCREVFCSECEQPPIKTGSCSYWIGDYAPRYCPNCGAKMDAGQEDDSHDGNKAG